MSKIIVAKDWNDIDVNKINPLRNTNQKYLKFINTNVFNEEARHFLKYKCYCNAPKGTKDYDDYWNEQKRRILNGYEVGGVRITGRHYFYLNFGIIEARPIDLVTGKEKINSKKIKTFPRFLDHNYYLFNELEECFAEGKYVGNPMIGMIIAKSRRKGKTYLFGNGVFSYNYNFIPDSKNVIISYEKTHYRVTLDAIHNGVNHINKNTIWAKRQDKKHSREHFRASFLYKDENGLEIEDGYMSEIMALSTKDNAFKSIGMSLTTCLFEEGGKNENLIETYGITEPTWRDGDYMTGVPFILGTGGDMESGTVDFCEMFYNPTAYGFKSYENIYDENAVGDCGWFIDDMWYKPGVFKDKETKQEIDLVDEQGNSNREYAEKILDEERKIKKKSTIRSYQTHLTQYPKTPAEAFLRPEGSIFDAVTANDRIIEIMTHKSTYLDSIYIVNLKFDNDGNVVHEIDTKSQSIRDYPIKKGDDTKGAIEIYEMPVKNNDGIVINGLYCASCDPYSDDSGYSSDSLASTFIMNILTERIVAEYTARPNSIYEYFENVRKLLLFYNAVCNYENTRKGMFAYFDKINSLHLLADTPEHLRDQLITKVSTTGNNRKGTPGSENINKYADGLTHHYLISQAYDRAPGITNLMTIRSLALLKEIIAYNPKKGNYDRIRALGQLLIYKEVVSKYKNNLINDENKEVVDDFFSKNNNKIGNSFLNF